MLVGERIRRVWSSQNVPQCTHRTQRLGLSTQLMIENLQTGRDGILRSVMVLDSSAACE
jgi:hypothetical protein